MICVDVVDCHSVIVLTYVLVCAANNSCCVSKSLSVFDEIAIHCMVLTI